ncbi:MAG: FecR family protein [Proteobacteria bacterium]|nr:FecR family protein [Pseudomonadota bacterium]MBU4447315.1 FecR family protein [Pseudomonadota bacterium]MCG2771369.1 FecR family protein [Desulfobacterales bacterium]
MAAEVGRFTQVEGQVELYKAKTTKPIPAQPQTAAEVNDRIKTEALSRAQLQFLDASTLTVAPLSDIVIESYMYDPKKGEQGALSRLTQGLIRLIVPVETLAKKEFLVKTPNAILGIRGTELFILIGPDFTDVYVKSGTVSASSNKPGKGDKVSMGSRGQKWHGDVARLAKQADVRAANLGRRMIGAMQASRIRAVELPSPTVTLTADDFATLERLLYTGLTGQFG